MEFHSISCNFTGLFGKTYRRATNFFSRVVLATLNQKFDKLLEKEEGREVGVETVGGEVLRLVVEHIYTGKIRPNLVNRENAKDLLAAAEIFELEEIKEEAAIFMAKHLDKENAIDVMTKDIFVGAVSNNAFAWVANNFQTFLDSEPLKKRMFEELGVGQLSHLLRQRGLMLWDKQGLYLPALEREKQLFFFVMAYVVHDKTTRLPDLARLLACLKLPLLTESKVLSLTVMAEGLGETEEELSGVLAEVLEPWEGLQVGFCCGCGPPVFCHSFMTKVLLQGDENLCTLFTDKSKMDQAERRALLESCRMRYFAKTAEQNTKLEKVCHYLPLHCVQRCGTSNKPLWFQAKLQPWTKVSFCV